MKIMSIISRIAEKSIVVPTISIRVVRKTIALPPIDERRIVELHPELIKLFNLDDQIRITFDLWYHNKLTKEQAIALCPEAEAGIESYDAYCEKMTTEYNEYIASISKEVV